MIDSKDFKHFQFMSLVINVISWANAQVVTHKLRITEQQDYQLATAFYMHFSFTHLIVKYYCQLLIMSHYVVFTTNSINN